MMTLRIMFLNEEPWGKNLPNFIPDAKPLCKEGRQSWSSFDIVNVTVKDTGCVSV